VNKQERKKTARLRRWAMALHEEGVRKQWEIEKKNCLLRRSLEELERKEDICLRFRHLMAFIQNIANNDLRTRNIVRTEERAGAPIRQRTFFDDEVRVEDLHVLQMAVRRNLEQFKTYVCLKINYKGQPHIFEYAFSESCWRGNRGVPAGIEEHMAWHIAHALCQSVANWGFPGEQAEGSRP
jgi:hypothetical protein